MSKIEITISDGLIEMPRTLEKEADAILATFDEIFQNDIDDLLATFGKDFPEDIHEMMVSLDSELALRSTTKGGN